MNEIKVFYNRIKPWSRDHIFKLEPGWDYDQVFGSTEQFYTMTIYYNGPQISSQIMYSKIQIMFHELVENGFIRNYKIAI